MNAPERSRDFFLQTGFASHLADHELVDAFAAVSDVFAVYGQDAVTANALALVVSDGYRRDFFGCLRNAAWLLRAARGGGSADRLEEARVTFAESVQLLAAAGFDLAAVRQLIGCLSHACTCDGCDLASGIRFARLAAEMETPATVRAVRGHGRVQPTNEPEGVTHVRSAE